MSDNPSTAIAVHTPPKASDQLASFLGIEKGMMLETLKAQCFKGKRPEEVSDAQLAAFVSTANVLQVNPLVPGMLFAYPERNGGITPILGPDGVFKKLDEFISSGKLNGFECDVEMGTDGKPVSATAIIHRRGEQKPAKYTAYYSEWAVTSNPNWQSRPRHMIWVRAIKQAARQVIHGLPMDADEYEIAQMQNVTPGAEAPAAPAAPRPEPPKRSRKGAAAVRENVQDGVIETAPEVAPAQTPVSTPPEDAAQKVADPIKQYAAAVKEAVTEKAVTETLVSQAATPLPRAFLKDGEEIVVLCEVVSLTPMNRTKDGQVVGQMVQAELKGGFVGTVYHLDAARVEEGGGIVANPPWAVGASLHVTLLGKMSAKSGKVQNFVQSVATNGPVAEGEEV